MRLNCSDREVCFVNRRPVQQLISIEGIKISGSENIITATYYSVVPTYNYIASKEKRRDLLMTKGIYRFNIESCRFIRESFLASL